MRAGDQLVSLLGRRGFAEAHSVLPASEPALVPWLLSVAHSWMLGLDTEEGHRVDAQDTCYYTTAGLDSVAGVDIGSFGWRKQTALLSGLAPEPAQPERLEQLFAG